MKTKRYSPHFAVALLANIPRTLMHSLNIMVLPLFAESIMAVGTGFGQLFRGIGQVGGVAVSSAIFQSVLDRELHKKIHTPDAEEVRAHSLPSN